MSTLAEQVVEQLKTDMDNVYDAGYQKGKSEGGGGLDVSKFGIINEVTGTNIATCDYVNENPHNVEVKLSSDNVTDFSGVEVKCIRKNCFDLEKAQDESKYVWGTKYPFFPVDIGKGNTFTFSCNLPNETNYTLLIMDNVDGNVIKYVWHDTSNNAGLRNDTITSISPNDYIYIRVGISNGNILRWLDDFTNIQIEISPVKTEYEPYTETLYTANADGTVDGITSISPTMNIICEGVDISAKYYCSPTAEYDRFWDGYQQYGNRTYYLCAFAYGYWTKDNFKPKYDIKPDNAYNMFYMSNAEYDFREHLLECGISFDTSNVTNAFGIFRDTRFTVLPTLDFSSGKCSKLDYTFNSSQYLHTIEKLIVTKELKYSSAFDSCSKLVNITFEGEIGSSINLQWSKLLEVESAKNIIRCLVNLIDTNPFTQTITFHIDVWDKLAEEGNTSPNGNTWEEYLFEIGWNKG